MMLFMFWLTLIFALLSLYPSAMQGLQDMLKDIITTIVMAIASIIKGVRRAWQWIRRL